MGQKAIIIGGVAGGATAAARLRRIDETADIVMFERGEHVSFANCGLPYYVGNVIKEREDLLLSSPELFRRRYNIDVRVATEVVAIDRSRKRVDVRDRRSGEVYTEDYDQLLLSPGAEPIRPPLEGIDEERFFTVRNVPDTDRIKAFVDERRPRAAVVVGGGFIGLEMAENLVHRGVSVAIVEMLDQVMPGMDIEMAAFIHDHLREKGVDLRLGDGVDRFDREDGRIRVKTKSGETIPCDMVVLSVGIRPESGLAREAGLDVAKDGRIRVDETMRTSDPAIFAVGDAAEMRNFVTGLPTATPLAGPANKQARVAADNIAGRRSIFRGTLGTAVVKVFDLAAASTGCGEKRLVHNELPYRVSYTHSGSHAGYYPGAESIAVKLIFCPGSGRILGAQMIGRAGVDKRIDVIATAIRGGMTVFDLEELELAYAPPYGSARDPVNIAGNVAANLMKRDVDNAYHYQVGADDLKDAVLLDLRTQPELEEEGMIDGAVHIPIDQLRDRLGELDRDATYIPYCAVGYRGYVGHRMLAQHGFKSRNLSGGYEPYRIATQRFNRQS